MVGGGSGEGVEDRLSDCCGDHRHGGGSLIGRLEICGVCVNSGGHPVSVDITGRSAGSGGRS